MRANPETCQVTTVSSPVVGEDAVLLYVPERFLQKGGAGRAKGTTLANFMPGMDKGNALDRGYGGHVLTRDGGLEGGLRAFWFAQERTSDEIGTPYLTETGITRGLYWPPVLGSITARDFSAYDADGAEYVADTAWDFAWLRKAYDGPCDIVIDYFASHAPFAITAAAGMRPEGGVFDYGVSRMTIPECLHTTLDLSYTTGSDNPKYPYQTFEKVFNPTNYSNWPEFIVLDDGETFEDGYYIRKRVKALRPYAIV